MVDPVQNLGDSFICSIEKVFLCTGTDGYVPKYNPSNFEFGCLADAPSLLYRFKIIVSNKLSSFWWIRPKAHALIFPFFFQDKAQPETQARSFGSVAFKAFLAVDDPGALALVRQPGSDGFRMDSSPLFQVSGLEIWHVDKKMSLSRWWVNCWSLQVSAGREWYIHTIYTVRSRDNANRGIGKRSVEYHSMSQATHMLPKNGRRARRSANDVPDIVEDIGVNNNRGTNILHIALDRSSQRKTSPEGEVFTKAVIPRELNQRDESDENLVLIVGLFVGLLLTVLLIIVVVVLIRSKHEKKDAPKKSSSGEPMVRGVLSNSDSSEV